MAFPDGWLHKVALSIDHTKIDADLTDWTLVIDQRLAAVLTSADGPLDLDGSRPSKVDGGDVYFSYDSAGAQRMAVDLRDWTPDNDPSSASCEIATKMPFVNSSADTTIYMWWGKADAAQPGVAESFGQYAAYDAATVFASADGGATNRVAGVLPSVIGTPGARIGLTGGAVLDYDGVDDYVDLGTLTNGFSAMTASTFARFDDISGDDGHFVFGKETVARRDWQINALYNAASAPAGTIRFTLSTTDTARQVFDANRLINDLNWHQYAIRFCPPDACGLIDGVLEVTQSGFSGTISPSSATKTLLGAREDLIGTTWMLDGGLSEVRISNVARSDAWLKAENGNLKSPATFFSGFGVIEDVTEPVSVSYDLALAITTTEALTASYDLAIAITTAVDQSTEYDLSLAVTTEIAEAANYDLDLAVTTAVAEAESYDLALSISIGEVVNSGYDLALAITTEVIESTGYDLALAITTEVAESAAYDLALSISVGEIISAGYDLTLEITTAVAEASAYDLALAVTTETALQVQYDLALAVKTVVEVSTAYDLALLIAIGEITTPSVQHVFSHLPVVRTFICKARI
jgi:hypothetical protein